MGSGFIRKSTGENGFPRKPAGSLFCSCRTLRKPPVTIIQARKGTNGVSTNGVAANFMLFGRVLFWVLPLTYFYLPKSARAYLFLDLSEFIRYLCSGSISADPICPQPTGVQQETEVRHVLPRHGPQVPGRQEGNKCHNFLDFLGFRKTTLAFERFMGGGGLSICCFAKRIRFWGRLKSHATVPSLKVATFCWLNKPAT